MPTTSPTATMTQDTWDRMSETARAVLRSTAGLTRQLIGYEGTRVEVIRQNGERVRFWVQRSTGWQPCHIEVKIKRHDIVGGYPADRDYQSVRLIRIR